MTSGVTERDRAKADRQAAILHEAARLFAERGFSGVSLEDLGAAVGVSGPAVYRHFANKQALLGAILVARQRAAAAPAAQRWSIAERRLPVERSTALIAVPRRLRPAPTPTSSACRTATSRASARRTATPVRRLQREYVELWIGSPGRAPPDAQPRPISACARTRASVSSTRRRTASARAAASPADSTVRGILESMAFAALTA